MSIDSIGGSQGGASSLTDSQTFGAQVVAKTLDYMNGQSSSSSMAAPVDKDSFGAAVVSKTLDYMNSGNQNGHTNELSNTYNFQKDVLGAHATGLGALANIKI
jgi:hypothetical protein